MKAFIFALVLLFVACPRPHPEGFSHEERIQRINNEFEINIKKLENEKEIEI